MDTRFIFFLTFTFTFVGTVAVVLICVLSGQQWLDTALYSLTSMWILGIISQILLQNIYQSIVVPLEDEKREEKQKRKRHERNLQEIERIQVHVKPTDSNPQAEAIQSNIPSVEGKENQELNEVR